MDILGRITALERLLETLPDTSNAMGPCLLELEALRAAWTLELHGGHPGADPALAAAAGGEMAATPLSELALTHPRATTARIRRLH